MTGRRILVIDDDPGVLRLASRLLVADGYEVIVARSGPLGLAMVESSAPDLIVLDLAMPEMDGRQVLAQLTVAGVDLPVIIFSSNNDFSRAEAIEHPLVVAQLGKMEFHRLAATVRDAIGDGTPGVAGEPLAVYDEGLE